MFVNFPGSTNARTVAPLESDKQSVSDHKAIMLEATVKKPPRIAKTKEKVKSRNVDPQNIAQYITWLKRRGRWTHIYREKDVDKCVEMFENDLAKAMDHFFPEKKDNIENDYNLRKWYSLD